jgi:serine protease Do
LGLALSALSPAPRRQLEVPEETGGTVVMTVEPGSPADLAGIVAGDVILGVGAAAVNDVREATRAIRQAQHEGRAVLLRVFRDRRVAFVAIEVTPSRG